MEEDTLVLVVKMGHEVQNIAALCQNVVSLCEDFQEKYKAVLADQELRLRALERKGNTGVG